MCGAALLSGEVHRASARGPLAPRGLGRDLPLPAEPNLGSAGYSLVGWRSLNPG